MYKYVTFPWKQEVSVLKTRRNFPQLFFFNFFFNIFFFYNRVEGSKINFPDMKINLPNNPG